MQVMTTKCAKVIEKMKKGFKKLENCEDDKSENGENILPMMMTYLTPAMIEEAKTQLHETDEVKEKTLAEFRRLIEAEKNLVTPTDDKFLLAFLRSRKFNVKKAFKLLQNYWSFRREYKRIYDLADAESSRALLLRNFIGFLKFRDRNGCLVSIYKIGRWDTEKDSYEDIFRTVSGLLVFSLEHEATQIAGFRIIIDLRDVTWAQLKYITPANVLLLIRSTQFCFPARYKGIHVLSENKMLNFIWGMAYPFLTPKLKKRIFFHGDDLKPLTQYIHPSILPQEYGGDAPTFSNDDMKDVIDSHKEKVLEHSSYGYRD